MLAIAIAFILPLTAIGQQFEQVSLTPAQHGNTTFHSDAVTLSAVNNTLKQLIQHAWGVEHTVIGGGSYSGSKISMAVLAQYLTTVVSMPVPDSTGLTGVYDVTLTFQSAVALPVALSDGLGLRLDRRKAPVEMLIVDHVEKQ